MNPHEINRRWVARAVEETAFVNTLNVSDRVTIDFVWYPGASDLEGSRISTIIEDAASGAPRWIHYTWERAGRPTVRRKLLTGRITVALPAGQAGTLTCFGTSWRISRAAAGVQMEPVADLRGVQRRLDLLGYHLRDPGAADPGVDGVRGRLTERAVLQFQADYRPGPHAAAPVANRLRLRGEWDTNADATFAANLQAYNHTVAVNPNPSTADGQALRAALVARVGA